jgi:hypothetical protein
MSKEVKILNVHDTLHDATHKDYGVLTYAVLLILELLSLPPFRS